MPYKNIVISNAQQVQNNSTKLNQFYRGYSSVDNANPGNKLFDFDLIKQDILNHFNTKKGERLMNPTFGTIVWDLIMEPLTPETRDLLKQDITEICNFDPRVSVSQIDLTEQEQGYIVELTLIARATNQTSNLVLIFNQQNGLTVQ